MSHGANGPSPEVLPQGVLPQQQQEEEDYTIKCVCRFDDDDGNTVYCERCETWQHIECYYHGRVVPEVHYCADCDPRPIDVRRALERQRRRREQGGVVEQKVKRSPAKVHKRKPRDVIAVAGHSGGNAAPLASTTPSSAKGASPAFPHVLAPLQQNHHASDRRNGVSRDQPPPAKRPKTNHRSSNSVTSQADVKRALSLAEPEACSSVDSSHGLSLNGVAAASPPDPLNSAARVAATAAASSASATPSVQKQTDYFSSVAQTTRNGDALPDQTVRQVNGFGHNHSNAVTAWIDDADALRKDDRTPASAAGAPAGTSTVSQLPPPPLLPSSLNSNSASPGAPPDKAKMDSGDSPGSTPQISSGPLTNYRPPSSALVPRSRHYVPRSAPGVNTAAPTASSLPWHLQRDRASTTIIIDHDRPAPYRVGLYNSVRQGLRLADREMALEENQAAQSVARLAVSGGVATVSNSKRSDPAFVSAPRLSDTPSRPNEHQHASQQRQRLPDISDGAHHQQKRDRDNAGFGTVKRERESVVPPDTPPRLPSSPDPPRLAVTPPHDGNDTEEPNPKRVRISGLRVELPTQPYYSGMNSRAGTPSSAASSIAQSPAGSMPPPLVFPPAAVSSVTQPSPVKKKLSLSDYVSRLNKTESSSAERTGQHGSLFPIAGSADKPAQPHSAAAADSKRPSLLLDTIMTDASPHF